MAELENWLVINNGAQFVPLPFWDPGNPVLRELNKNNNTNINMPLPASFEGAPYMTDADQIPRGRQTLESFWREQLCRTTLITSVVGKRASRAALRTVSANTARLDRVGGSGWLAVGDAALSYDPLSAHGIVGALESGVRAAQATIQILQGRSHATTEYATWIEGSFHEFLRGRTFHYARVTR